MSDITASERRLSAALDRIDQLLEAGVGRASDGATDADAGVVAALQAENARLSAELAGRAPADGDDSEARLAEAIEQSARLAAANEQLVEANRALIDAGAGPDALDAANEALLAEIEALRASRASELAQMGDIMAELERLLGSRDGTARAAAPEAAGDGVGVPEDSGDQEGEGR